MGYNGTPTERNISCPESRSPHSPKPTKKPKFVQEIEADLESADRYEEWVRKIDETLWQLEVGDLLNAK